MEKGLILLGMMDDGYEIDNRIYHRGGVALHREQAMQK